jgi:hypothetical protein
MIRAVLLGLIALLIVQFANWAWVGMSQIASSIGGFKPIFEIIKGFGHRGTVVRFSASAVLKFENPIEDDQFLLCRSRKQSTHGTWGPLGGVIKCNRERNETEFSRLGIRFHRSSEQSEFLNRDMLEDLRVAMRRRSIRKFLRWFAKDIERESSVNTLVRELQEELEEGIGDQPHSTRDAEATQFANDLNALLPRLSWDINHRPVVAIYSEAPGSNRAPRRVLHIKAYYVVTPNDREELGIMINRAIAGNFGQSLGWFDQSQILSADGRNIGIHSQALTGKIDSSKQLPIYSPENLIL